MIDNSRDKGGNMSQHLVNDFISRHYIFKPFTGGKIINNKVIKYQSSTRRNNTSPEDVEESVHYLKPMKPNKSAKEDAEKEQEEKDHIDITV